jgi:beta-glucosidase
MCTHRHPLGGRNFESFSEDPYLAGKLAAQNVLGVESTSVSATIKHFAANEQETQRLSVDEIISERALREIYLKPFEIAVKEAKPGAVMTAYNKVNGHHADSQTFLLQQVLRGEWGWDGLVMSDWGGTNSVAAALNAGLDLEMPGPTRWRKVEDVLQAIKAGEVSEQTIDVRTLHVLQFLERQKCFDDPKIPDEQAINKPEHQALIREAGAKGIVLLKNNGGVLPLTKEKVQGKKIAIFGLAKECLSNGGGSASVNAHYKISPWDALSETWKDDNVELVFAEGLYKSFRWTGKHANRFTGARTLRQLPLISENVVDNEGGSGFTLRKYNIGETKAYQTLNGQSDSQFFIHTNFDVVNTNVELEGVLTAPRSENFYMTLSGLGPSKVLINDKLVYEQTGSSPDPMGFLLGGVSEELVEFAMEAGQKYKILITSSPPTAQEGEDLGILEGKTGVRLGCMSKKEHDTDLLGEAVALAKEADYALVFTGHTTAWETEGQDQTGFNLPKDGSQDRLVAGVAAANPNTIVVNSTGVAIAMPWLDNIAGLLQTWFPGQEAGNSIADILTGKVNPEGALTCSFPKELSSAPAHGNFPGEYKGRQLTVNYAEGVFVGYRHFDTLPADKLNFPFGFGLSYTTFEHEKFSVKPHPHGEEWTVAVDVKNTGKVAGAAVVQIYVGSSKRKPENPIKALVAFGKATLEAGESKVVELRVKARDFASWSEKEHRWVVEAGEYEFGAWRGAGDLVSMVKVDVDAWSGAP